MENFGKPPIPNSSGCRLNARKVVLREFFGWLGTFLRGWVELATVWPSKRIFLMGDFLPSGLDRERGQKNSWDIWIKLPHFPPDAQRFPANFQGWVAPATKRGCIATCKRALQKFFRERMICFFKSPRLSIQKIIPRGGSAKGKKIPLRQKPPIIFYETSDIRWRGKPFSPPPLPDKNASGKRGKKCGGNNQKIHSPATAHLCMC